VIQYLWWVLYIVDDTSDTKETFETHIQYTEHIHRYLTPREPRQEEGKRKPPPFSKMTPSHVARLKEKPGVVTCSKEGEGGKAGLPNGQPFLMVASRLCWLPHPGFRVKVSRFGNFKKRL
jgi:hypothetical protein